MSEASTHLSSELSRASSLIKQHKFDEAAQIFTGLLAAPASAPDGMYGLGVIAFLKEDFATAANWIHYSLAVRPDNANAVYYLGLIAEKSDPGGHGSDLYHRALQIDPEHRGARKRLNELGIRPVAAKRDMASELPPIQPPATQIPISDATPSFYQALIQDKSALGMQTRRLIDDIQSKNVRPALTAYLGRILGISLFWMIVLLSLAVSPLGQRRAWTPSSVSTLAVDTITPMMAEPGSLQTHTVLNPGPLLLITAIAIATVVLLIVRIKTTLISFDHGRIAIEHGVFHRSTATHELLRVHDVSIERTLFNRLTGDGTLVLQLSGPQQGRRSECIKLRGYAKRERLQPLMVKIRDLVLLLRTGPWGKGVIY